MSNAIVALLGISESWNPPDYSGELYSWGSGGSSNTKLGTGAAQLRSSPVQVGALTNWLKLSVGETCVFAIKSDGTLWAWGAGDVGELGIGIASARRSSPVQIGALTNWREVSTFYHHTMAIKSDGSLWGWGYNASGAIGRGNTTNYSSPVQIGFDTAWSQVSAGFSHTLAVKMDGTLWAWGGSANGQLGLNNATNYSSPVQVGRLTNWFQASAGTFISAAIKADGTLWTWGEGTNGALGQGNKTTRSSPVQVGALTDWVFVVAGSYWMGALKKDGTLWVWGVNTYGQLGQGNTTSRSSPVQVGSATNWRVIALEGAAYSQVSGGMAAVNTLGELWSWGAGSSGQNDNSSIANVSSPIQIGSGTTWVNAFRGGGVLSATGGAAVFGLRNASASPPPLPSPGLAGYGIYIMGDNSNGNLSYAGYGNILLPLFISNALRWRTVSCLKNLTSFGVRSDSKAYSVGSDQNGYRGNGAVGYLPIAIGSDTNWYQISCGLGIRGGALYAWGANSYGQLGLGDTTNRSSPVQVGALTTWKSCNSNGATGAAIRTNGTLWMFGLNDYGQLGQGNTTNRSSPVQVGALTNWSSVVVGANDTNTTVMAIKTDGTLWGWGYNENGIIGDGTTTNRSSPVQIGSATNWIRVTLGFALNSAGQIWQLGESLVQIAGNWIDIASSGEHQVACDSDGNAWSWGLNDHGQLGLGDTTNRSSPTQIPEIYNAKRAVAAPGVSVVLRPVGGDA